MAGEAGIPFYSGRGKRFNRVGRDCAGVCGLLFVAGPLTLVGGSRQPPPQLQTLPFLLPRPSCLCCTAHRNLLYRPLPPANGAEFVEMFQGVAAARIRSLFRAARKNSPSIIFIGGWLHAKGPLSLLVPCCAVPCCASCARRCRVAELAVLALRSAGIKHPFPAPNTTFPSLPQSPPAAPQTRSTPSARRAATAPRTPARRSGSRACCSC